MIMEHRQRENVALEEVRAKLAWLKEHAAQKPKEAMPQVEEIVASINQQAETDEWCEVKAEAYYCLSLAQTASASYDEAVQSGRKALLLFKQLNKRDMMASVLNNLGRIEYYRAYYHKSLDFYNDSLTLRRELGDKKGIAAALNNIGLIYYSIENHAAALKCYEESLALKRELGDKKGMASTLNNIGMIHVLLSDYPKAIECYTESLNLRDPKTEIREITNIQLNIGEVYLSLGNHYKALQLFEEALTMSRESGDKRLEAIATSSLGNVYNALKEFDKALGFYQEALARFEEIGLQNSIATELGNIAGIYESKGEHNLAFEYYQQSLQRLCELGDQSNIVRVMILIGKTLIAQKNYDLAKTYLTEAIAASEKHSMRRQSYEAFEQLAILYEQLGDFESAYRAYQNYHTIREAVFNEEQGKKIAVQQALFENELARKEAERHKQQNIELTKALAETKRLKAIAEEANTFKTELLGIAAHDLKNPLQSVIGFAQLIQEDKDNKPKTHAAAATIERVAQRMYKLIEELLNNVKLEMTGIALCKSKVVVADLLRAVVANYQADAERKSQTIELDLDENCLAELDAERMREVFENLISNAIKYSPRSKTIRVSLTQVEKGAIRVAVKDEGQGLTEADKAKLFGKFQRLSARPTGGESSTGLGLSIVKQIVELHGGKVWAESEGKDKGATFFVELPTQ
ncbi:MAG: tetratricopeptide repeat protein [Chloroherpetonaceae bacterium]